MEILKVISVLLDYPRIELQLHSNQLIEVIQNASEIPPAMRRNLTEVVNHIAQSDLMDLQETYDGLFERGRAISLLLFEHVYGESRDRGQAMVDLMNTYAKDGFEINIRELPDYIPLYLEYLATREAIDAREGLADVAHILGLVSARLKDRDSLYHHLIDAMLIIAGVQVDENSIREQVAKEERDDSLEAMDKIWEEEMITFSSKNAAEQCTSQRQFPPPGSLKTETISPVHWVHPSEHSKSHAQYSSGKNLAGE
jgi:nitrate reductase delta subunit